MREMFYLPTFLSVFEEKLKEHKIDYQDFLSSEYGKAFGETIYEVPLSDRSYSEKDIDFYVKINTALINKFREELHAEYGTEMIDIYKMFQQLYKEEYERDPRLWYEQGILSNAEN